MTFDIKPKEWGVLQSEEQIMLMHYLQELARLQLEDMPPRQLSS